jgi:Predicted membrane protein
MWWYGGHGAWGGWVVMGLAMLAFWSILIAAVVVIVKSWRGGDAATAGGTAHEPEDALRVLDQRFARGEIDADEYTTRRDLLLLR